MNPLNEILRQTFQFSSNDLIANRDGQLSPKQQARQQAAGTSLKMGIAFFILVMLGTFAFFIFTSLFSGTFTSLDDPDTKITLAIVVGVIGFIMAMGYFSSRKHMATTRTKQIQKAEGEAQPGKIRPDAAHFELKIGRAKIRLLTEEQLQAFQAGTAYRVHYLAGPIPTILSAEVMGTEEEAAVLMEQEPPLEQDSVLQAQKRARRVVAILAILTLGFPTILLLASNLPGFWFLLVLVLLFGVGILFVFWAMRK